MVLVDRSGDAQLAQTAKSILSLPGGGAVTVVETDVRDPKAGEKIVEVRSLTFPDKTRVLSAS